MTEAPDYGANVPSNQPSNRFAGHRPVEPHPADPLPDWLAGEPRKLGPILGPDRSVPWRARAAFNAGAVAQGGKVYLFVRFEDETGRGKWFGTSRIGLAVSTDGVHFSVRKDPVLEPTEWYEAEGGTEDPRVTRIAGRYYMTYTGYRWAERTARLCLAVSDDLVRWKKMGPVFPDGALQHKPDGMANWSKSGAIVPRKINGEYLMYFGDDNMYLARSKDLLRWKPDAEPVLGPREGYFDGIMVEPGPPPEIDPDGNIRLLYNGDAPPDGYGAGEVVFSGMDPRQVLRRRNHPLIQVTEDWERTGQVGNVIFLEGLTRLGSKIFFYYGAADNKVAVAVADAPKAPGAKE